MLILAMTLSPSALTFAMIRERSSSPWWRASEDTGPVEIVTVPPWMAMINDGTATTTTIVVTKTVTKRVDKKVTIDVIIRTFPRRLERGGPPKLATAGC